MGAIREIMSGANKRLSSKRITGAFCVVSATIVIIIIALTDPTFPSISSLLECILFTGAGLLGLGVAERRFTDASNTKTSPKANADGDARDEDAEG